MDQLVGHTALQDLFRRLRKQGTLNHAYLFVGPAFAGKTTFIRHLCGELLETPREQLDVHPDLSWVRTPVDGKTGRSKTTLPVESIRQLRERLGMSALHGGWRIAVIEDAAAMNLAAANALLKILEEPPPRTLILLRATAPEDVPQTIVSRTQIVRVGHVASEQIVQALVARGASTREAQELAHIAAGRPGLAFTLFHDRQAYQDWRTQAELFRNQFEGGVAGRMVFATRLAPKKQERDHAAGERIFHIWESVLRERLREDTASARWVQALERLEESRRAFFHHSPLQLSFEHTLLHL